MRARRELGIEADAPAPRRRAELAGAQAQGTLWDGPDAPDFSKPMKALPVPPGWAAVGDLQEGREPSSMKTEWIPGSTPPERSGWYEVRLSALGPFPLPGHVERIWFDAPRSTWFDVPGGEVEALFVMGLEWRGLLKPWAYGYRWTLPGARRYRARLEAA